MMRKAIKKKMTKNDVEKRRPLYKSKHEMREERESRERHKEDDIRMVSIKLLCSSMQPPPRWFNESRFRRSHETRQTELALLLLRDQELASTTCFSSRSLSPGNYAVKRTRTAKCVNKEICLTANKGR